MFAASKTASVSGQYQISRSLRFNSADSAYLARTPASASNQQIWTINTWVKRSKLGTLQTLLRVSGVPFVLIDFTADDKFSVDIYNGSVEYILKTTQVFRDVSAWGMMTIAVDTTQATSSNRVKIYWNGVQITAFVTADYPPQNNNTALNSTAITYIGGNVPSSNQFTDFYLTEFILIDGQQLTPSSFGETNVQTGVWQPKFYAGTYGTNGFYINFSDNSNTTAATLGKDYSGNGNNWTPNNFSVTAGAGNDSLVDSPTSYGTDTGVGGTVRGNYCTYNPLVVSYVPPTYSNGNLDLTAATGWNDAIGTIGVTSGKWYWEAVCGNSDSFIGICGSNAALSDLNPQNSTGTIFYFISDGTKRIDGTSSAYGASATTETIGVALDIDGGAVTFYKNNTSQGSISLSSSTLNGKTIFPFFVKYLSTMTVNFGQRPFAYTAPSGFKALCTQNLPTPTIGATTATQAGKYFNPVLYTGNGSARSITGVGFQPDFTWIKLRDTNSSNGLFDAVRGATKRLVSDTTAAEDTISGVTSFDSDGFSLGTSYNGSSFLYVAWNWKANGAGSSNTAGSITSTVSANTTSGFSVVTYTGNGTSGASVGHGLGVTPAMVIIKQRTATDGWLVYHQSVSSPTSNYLALNTTAASASASGWLTPSSSTLTFTTSYGGTNGNGLTLVAYCFAEVAGYSKFGSYTGNGSTDGPFVFTNMRPAYIMVKRTDTGGANMNWIIWDATRNTRNVVGEEIYANLSDAGTTYTDLDFVSNGFKIRNSTTWYNASGGTYIYMAFAQNPFKFSLAR